MKVLEHEAFKTIDTIQQNQLRYLTRPKQPSLNGVEFGCIEFFEQLRKTNKFDDKKSHCIEY